MNLITEPRPQSPELNPDQVLRYLASRHSTREFLPIAMSNELIDAIISDGLEAPTACNHQMWHFVVVRDQATKEALQKISGSNDHFVTSAVIILPCFHMGWNHNKYAVIQGSAAAIYHMSLSAHLRGLAATWNAGIGNGDRVKGLVGIPHFMEIIGALCIGYPDPAAPSFKPPRRPLEVVRSYERFLRPETAIYPLKPAHRYRYTDLLNHKNRYAVYRPAKWGWSKMGDFRSYAVFAKSPLPGVYVSRRFGKEMTTEVDLIGEVKPAGQIAEIMPYGGSYTVHLMRRFATTAEVHVVELSQRNLDFVHERVLRETGSDKGLHEHVMIEGKLPFADDSLDVVFMPQILEAIPDPGGFLDEVVRVLRPGGRLVATARNPLSWFGVAYLTMLSRGQVPNFGPYVPRLSFKVHLEIGRRMKSTKSVGISLLPSQIGRLVSGPLRFFSRLYGGEWIKQR